MSCPHLGLLYSLLALATLGAAEPSGLPIFLGDQRLVIFISDASKLEDVTVAGAKLFIRGKAVGDYTPVLSIESMEYDKTLSDYEAEQGFIAKKDSFAEYSNDGKKILRMSFQTAPNGVELATIQQFIVHNGRCYMSNLVFDKSKKASSLLEIMSSVRYIPKSKK